MIGAIYDRDYFCEEFIQEVIGTLRSKLKIAQVLARKEIENYLLIPTALDRAIARVIDERAERSARRSTNQINSAKLLDEITRPMKSDVMAQLMARRDDFFRPKGKDRSQAYRHVMASLEAKWENLGERIILVPGKEVLARLRERAHEMFGITLTESRIAEALRKEEIPEDMCSLVHLLEQFRQTHH
jgi:hypothetical protein